MTTATTTAAVTSPNTGLRVDVFVHGGDGALWSKYTTNGGPRGLTGTVSAGDSHPERNLRSLHGQQAASTSLYKGRMAPFGINGLQMAARSGPTGEVSAESWGRDPL